MHREKAGYIPSCSSSSDAKEIYEMAEWLTKERKFKLGEEVPEVGWDDLRCRFKKSFVRGDNTSVAT